MTPMFRSSIRVPEDLESSDDSIPLDKLIIDDNHRDEGIRILVRPLTRSRSVSPGSDSCRWLALRAEVAAAAAEKAETKVLAVTQTSKDINFALRIPGESGVDETRPPIWCELYYDPASDNQILYNRSDVPITLTKLSLSLVDGEDDYANFEEELVPGTTKELCPASWRLSVYGTGVIDFRVLSKRAATVFSATISSSSDALNSSAKRSFSEKDGGEVATAEKRRRIANVNDDGAIVFYPQALLQVGKDETIAIPGGYELDQYQLTKRDQIATTAASSVFTAQHSKVPEVPDGGVITVKVLKTSGPNNARPQDSHRNVIRQADVWLREYRSQDDLQHESIVKLYGGDARYLSLYMEHVDGKDLAARSVWRDAGTDIFTGDRADAVRILKDIAGALNYVHQRKRVHNDIKPANILYSRDRGAVLCDFGLSTLSNDAATNGGTPYYVPPEFIGKKLRGSPSDVWALGVTMLYVLKKITFPDARGRQGHPSSCTG
ncbi:hypothetical protein PG997_012758 [Apiospora hydei]|uniref:Protein kinase domain-containing protein n=1 Tax=Apiospora hydei TaxID=1337664 RepID=A0ABR1V4B4_9PEZI